MSDTTYILLIEDNPDDALLLRRMVGKINMLASCNVHHVPCLQDGLDYLIMNRADVVLVDLRLPDSSGLDTVTRIHSVAQYLPVIVMTGLDDEQLAREALRAGAQDYLIKDKTDHLLLERAIRYAIERKHADDALRESSRRYQQVIEHAEQVVFSTDSKGFFTYVNNSVEKLTGYTPQDLIGIHFTTLIPTPYREYLVDFYKTQFTRKLAKTQIDFPITTRSDEQKWVEQEVILRFEGDHITGFEGIVRDITQRREIEDALRRSETKSRALINSLPDATLRLAYDGSILDFHPGALIPEMDNLTPPLNRYQQHEEFLWSFAENILPRLKDVSRINSSITVEYQSTMNHKLCDLEVRFYAIDDEEVIALVRDVTDRKNVERKNMEVERLRIELEKARELRDLKNRFMSTVSHEFGTPLAIILLAAEMMEVYWDRLDETRRKTQVEKIKTEIAHLRGLVDDVNLVMQTESGQLSMEFEPLNLKALSHELVSDLQMTIGVNHRMAFDCEGDFTQFVTNRKMMERIFVNLLSNAIKYSPKGGEVRLKLIEMDDEIKVEVSDEGIGIPAEDQKQLFQPYHRARNVGPIKGIGLGLRIVKDVVTLQQGRIEVDSEEGVGSTFRIFLPKVQKTESQPIAKV